MLFRRFREECPEILARKTHENINALMARFDKWATAQRVDQWSEEVYGRWLLSLPGLRPSTRRTYLKGYQLVRRWALASAAKKLDALFSAQGANVPTRQAPPMHWSLLDHPKLTSTRHVRMQIWLAWKTASRWADLTQLTADDFTIPNEHTLIVDWGTKTKASRRRPFRASKYTVIQGSRTPELIAWVRSQRGRIAWLETSQVTRILNQRDPSLSAHSIKAGATVHLERAVAAGKLSLKLKQRLPKHEVRDVAFETSLTYGRDKIAQALSLRTYLATRLL